MLRTPRLSGSESTRERSTTFEIRRTGENRQTLHRLSDDPSLGNSDLVSIAVRVPRGAIWLISALSHRNLTTHIPQAICIALPSHAPMRRIRIDRPV